MRLLTIILLLLLTAACNGDTSNITHLEVPADTIKVARDNNNSEGEFVDFNLKNEFEDFEISVYRGRLADPRVTDQELSGDTSFINYISEACKSKDVNFGGHYTVVQSNCGAMCEGLYIVDRISGDVFSKLKPNKGGRWGYLYKKNSKMLIANSNGLDSSLQHYSGIFDAPEVYVWTGNTLKQIQ